MSRPDGVAPAGERDWLLQRVLSSRLLLIHLPRFMRHCLVGFWCCFLASCLPVAAQLAPTITVQPVALHAALGGPVTFSATATGTEPMSYQWYGSFAPIGGATSRTLTLPAVSSANAGVYWVEVTNVAGRVLSEQVLLTVIPVENTAPVARAISGSANAMTGAPAPVSSTSGSSAPIGTRIAIDATFGGAMPLSFQWTRDGVALPGQTGSGLILNNAQIADSGVYRVTATNSRGTATSASYTVAINPYNLPPLIVTQPLPREAKEGLPASLMVSARGELPFTYEWERNGVVIRGANTETLLIPSVSNSDAGVYRVRVANRHGVTVSNTVGFNVTSAGAIPTIIFQPSDTTTIAGRPISLTISAGGTQPISYQWLRNGIPVPGAVLPTLKFDATSLADAGDYSVIVSNSVGSVTSGTAVLRVLQFGRLSNLSVLTTLAGPTDSFTVGYVVGGNGTSGRKPVVVRAAGPSLAPLGVPSVLGDPKLETFARATKTGENDDWSGGAALISAFSAVGAFPYAAPSSKDAAVATSVDAGENSVRVSSADGKSGAVIAEVYDATPPASFALDTPRLLNVSVLKSISSTMTVGFTTAGGSNINVLIRAVGPTLADFGISGVMSNPQISLIRAGESQPIATNDAWGGHPYLAAMSTAAGAFPLPANSKDSVLATSLPPGSWTAVVSGVGGSTGVVLVEVYEMP